MQMRHTINRNASPPFFPSRASQHPGGIPVALFRVYTASLELESVYIRDVPGRGCSEIWSIWRRELQRDSGEGMDTFNY